MICNKEYYLHKNKTKQKNNALKIEYLRKLKNDGSSNKQNIALLQVSQKKCTTERY